MTVSVMIATRNRVGELGRTLDRLQRMNPLPSETWVVADGCTDATVDYIRHHHSHVHLIVHERAMGSVASRDEIMRQASGDLVLALDDDSYPEQDDCLTKLILLFTGNHRLAIATFPQRSDEYPEMLTRKDFGSPRLVRSFANSGACLRVSTYRSLPGFEPMFFHMYEEPDYALQCIASGWDVLYFPQITIRHHYVRKERSELRNHHRHARNEFWSTLMRCPFPQALPLLFYRVMSQARFAASRGLDWLAKEPIWWWQVVKGIPNALRKRQPVLWSGYRRWLHLPN